uniref:Uncharacterized protein n=1 Tax=Culex tarsalis TaxID=7177 RepID=A0A1Q3FR77_CULTA
MGQKLSHREQRAADIRESLLWHRDHRPSDWGSRWRSEAVRRGVIRNNARHSDDDQCCGCCCGCFGLLISVAVLVAVAWYAWSRALQAGHQMATDFPGLEPGRHCGENGSVTSSVVRAVNCTLSFYSMFTQTLVQVWNEMAVEAK